MLILFNFDGTLVDNAMQQYIVYTKACEQLEIEPKSEKGYFSLINHEHPLEELHKEQASDIQQIVESISDIKPIPRTNLKKLFKELQELGHKIGILTSKDARVHKELEELGIKEFLETVKCAFDVYAQKPDPAVFDAVYEEGFDPGNILYIGDTLSDLQAAKEAGIRFLGVVSDVNGHRHFKREGLQEDEIIYSLAEILNYLQKEEL